MQIHLILISILYTILTPLQADNVPLESAISDVIPKQPEAKPVINPKTLHDFFIIYDPTDSCFGPTFDPTKLPVNLIRVPELMKACEEKNLNIVKQLIKEGTSVNVLDHWEFLRGGTSVLGYALLGGSKEIIETLLAAGANPNAVINRGVFINDDLTVRIVPILTYAIAHAMDLEIIKLLIDAGADVSAIDTIHYNIVTPLIAASALGQQETIDLLLKAGADKDYKNKYTKTAFNYAQEYTKISYTKNKLAL